MSAAMAADTVEQPLADYVRGRTFAPGETLLRWSSDLNADGREDVLVSRSSQAGNRGGAEWAVYLSLPGARGYVLASTISLAADSISVLREGVPPGGPLIVCSYSAGGGMGTIAAYRFPGTEVVLERLGTIHERPEDQTAADRVLEQRYLAPATESATEVVALDSVTSAPPSGDSHGTQP